jgi:hypothetical protein
MNKKGDTMKITLIFFKSLKLSNGFILVSSLLYNLIPMLITLLLKSTVHIIRVIDWPKIFAILLTG